MITIPKIIKPLPLVDYAPEMADQSIQVHVNVSRLKLDALQGAIASGDLDQVYAWLSEVWQGETFETVKAFADECAQTDPQLLTWLSMRTIQLINEHRAGTIKN